MEMHEDLFFATTSSQQECDEGSNTKRISSYDGLWFETMYGEDEMDCRLVFSFFLYH